MRELDHPKGNGIHSIRVTKENKILVIFKTGTVWYPSLSEIEIMKNLTITSLIKTSKLIEESGGDD